jgi:hypothetical protein
MKKLIVEEVNSFRAEVRAQARAASQVRQQERCTSSPSPLPPQSYKISHPCSLPIPSRDEILSSPVGEHAPANGATSGYTAPPGQYRPPSPMMDDPSAELERELAGTHIGGGRR